MTGWRSTGVRRMLLREVLVAGQIAVSVVLLTGAGMLLRSLWNLQNVSLGLNAEHVVTADFILGKQRHSEDVRQLQFFDDLESRLRSIPGATAFTISDSLPPYGGVRAAVRCDPGGRTAAISRGHRRYGGLAVRDAGLFQYAGSSNRAGAWV